MMNIDIWNEWNEWFNHNLNETNFHYDVQIWFTKTINNGNIIKMKFNMKIFATQLT